MLFQPRPILMEMLKGSPPPDTTNVAPEQVPSYQRVPTARSWHLTDPHLLPRDRFLRHCSDPTFPAPDFATAIGVVPARRSAQIRCSIRRRGPRSASDNQQPRLLYPYPHPTGRLRFMTIKPKRGNSSPGSATTAGGAERTPILHCE